jgi:hypothetical protein
MRRGTMVVFILGLLLLSTALVHAQQALMPAPTPQAELGKCREYTQVLLNNTMRYEALAQELVQQKMALEKERDEALAKLKEKDSGGKPDAAPKNTN